MTEPMYRARSVRNKGGGVNVWDYRGTGLLNPNGGLIRPLMLVHHIPVIDNMRGTVDFMVLARVLRQQGLAIQQATDSEGNVALFTRLNQLCYGQRGANSQAGGVEHMHKYTSEAWTDKQAKAAAWTVWNAFHSYGIPIANAVMAPGNGQVRVQRRGNTSHMAVSRYAGYNDRSDPGPGFPWERIYALARYFDKHRSF